MNAAPPVMASFSKSPRWRRRFVRFAVYIPLVTLLLGLFFHPYTRQLAFGPKIDGEPVWSVQQAYRQQHAPEENENKVFARLGRYVGLRSGEDSSTHINRRDPKMASVLLDFANDTNPAIRAAALRDLVEYHPSPFVASLVVRQLDDPNAKVRGIALSCLTPAEPKAIRDKVEQMLDDPDGECALRAAQCCRSMGVAPDRLVPTLRRGLADPISDVRGLATHAVGQMASEMQILYPQLVATATSDADVHVRSRALYALARFGRQSLPTLIDALRDPNRSVRSGAFHGIDALAPEAKEAIPALLKMRASLQREDEAYLREQIDDTLHTIDPERFPARKNEP